MVVEVNLFCLFVFCLFFVFLLLFSFAVCGLTGESRNKRTGLINVIHNYKDVFSVDLRPVAKEKTNEKKNQ